MTHRLIGANELAEALSVPISWVYSRTRIKGDGQIPNIRCGKYVRFDIDAVLDWLEKKGEAA
jgi:predicted DNA-binding transcriptional regulator AlpA